jgi:hypothetical protein
MASAAIIHRAKDEAARARRGQRNGAHRTQSSQRSSGSANRLIAPDSVRYMSVTTATQRPTAALHDTRCDSSKTAHDPENTQVTGRFRWWWQVLGSNQRRLSRRIYSTLPPAPPCTI